MISAQSQYEIVKLAAVEAVNPGMEEEFLTEVAKMEKDAEDEEVSLEAVSTVFIFYILQWLPQGAGVMIEYNGEKFLLAEDTNDNGETGLAFMKENDELQKQNIPHGTIVQLLQRS